MTRAAQFRGCLLGAAVGDALGAPLEFMDAKEIARKHGRVTEMLGGGWLHLPIGHYTDDTQMMLCLAESLVEKNAFDADDIARRFVAWLESSPPDVGIHTRAVLSRIARGENWRDASGAVQNESPNSAGNGSVMRCAPLALFSFRDADALREYSRAQSEITHAHLECQWSCVFINAMSAHLLDGENRENALQSALSQCDGAPESVLATAQNAAAKTRAEIPTSGYVLHTLEGALWSFLTTETLEDALIEIVNLGGDADTAGAVCGALAGAFYGDDAIPARWLEVLQNREHLVSLADAFFARAA